MTRPDHHRGAQIHLGVVKHTIDNATVERDATNYHLAAAQVHATLAVADRLGALLDAWRADVDNEPVELDPEIERMVNDWIARPNCTACDGKGKQPGHCPRCGGEFTNPSTLGLCADCEDAVADIETEQTGGTA